MSAASLHTRPRSLISQHHWRPPPDVLQHMTEESVRHVQSKIPPSSTLANTCPYSCSAALPGVPTHCSRREHAKYTGGHLERKLSGMHLPPL
uniref:Uncharacterized protein n=1 Tax=Knipowitschia caucasica TaxID=637954 RepID=A0AAV2JEB8_KNICA